MVSIQQKKKVLISSMVMVQLICSFVFAYAGLCLKRLNAENNHLNMLSEVNTPLQSLRL